MSSVYNLEPPTSGKVVLTTTLGDIEIELWSKEAPKASRNFLQLCLEDYYNGTIFHRVIRDFMVQGGDPTGSGSGGASIYGRHFDDEFHSRLRFTHRGILACANENVPSTNGSQFFITLGACPHLNKKHTIFGKVVGDSIYNVINFNDLETDSNDFPLNPPKILTTNIIWNPFDDIVPRTYNLNNSSNETSSERPKVGKRAKKQLGLLSFGDEASRDDLEQKCFKVKVGSVFDSMDKNNASIIVTEDTRTLQDKVEIVKKDVIMKKDQIEGQITPNGSDEISTFKNKMQSKIQEKRETLSRENNFPKIDNTKVDAAKRKINRSEEAIASGLIKRASTMPSKLLSNNDTSLLTEFEKKRLEAKERTKLSRARGNKVKDLLLLKKDLVASAINNKNLSSSETIILTDELLPAAWRVDKNLEDYVDEKFMDLVSHKFEAPLPDANSIAEQEDDYLVQDPLYEKNIKWDRKSGKEKRKTREWAANSIGPIN